MKYLQAAIQLLLVTGSIASSGAASGMPNPVAAHDAALNIPIDDESGHRWSMQGHICLPEGVRKPQLVVIAYGSPPDATGRPGMLLAGCHSEAVQWFLHRRRAVALLLRLGYGATGGPWTEGYDGCEKADFYQAGMETARQLDAMVAYLVQLPQLDPKGVIVVGQSAGGWGALAYDSMAHPHVAAFIAMAGGRGGHYQGKPDSNCHPERLIDAASRFGRTATAPVLWIAAKNDSYFNPELASSMAKAFNQAGGKAQFEAVGAFGDDGHHLFFGHDGSLTWGTIVEHFIKSIPDTPLEEIGTLPQTNVTWEKDRADRTSGVRNTRFPKICSRMHFPETATWRRRNEKAASLPKQQVLRKRRALGTAEIGRAAVSRSAAEETHTRSFAACFRLATFCHPFMLVAENVLSLRPLPAAPSAFSKMMMKRES